MFNDKYTQKSGQCQGWFGQWLRNKSGDTIASRHYQKKHHVRYELEKEYPIKEKIICRGLERITRVTHQGETVTVITDINGNSRYV
jgi:hypothetical protein